MAFKIEYNGLINYRYSFLLSFLTINIEVVELTLENIFRYVYKAHLVFYINFQTLWRKLNN